MAPEIKPELIGWVPHKRHMLGSSRSFQEPEDKSFNISADMMSGNQASECSLLYF